MDKKWKVFIAYVGPRQPTHAPDQLEDVLNRLEREGWEVVSILGPDKDLEVRVVARMDSAAYNSR